MDNEFIIVTANEVAGYEITDVYGEVFGLVVRSRNIVSNIAASLRGVIGREVHEYNRLLTDSRNNAINRMTEEANKKGANAVVAMRFDASEIGSIFTEVVAYGTAVRIEKRSK
jgi:uncharacterized protein YbjQ (UPF0145 family)